jgi:hypothetical protein
VANTLGNIANWMDKKSKEISRPWSYGAGQSTSIVLKGDINVWEQHLLPC